MASLVDEEVDIYRLPAGPTDHRGSLTIGDLHGNTVKLVHCLVLHGIVAFKTEVAEPEAAYEAFADCYERAGELSQRYLELRSQIVRATRSAASHKAKLGAAVDALAMAGGDAAVEAEARERRGRFEEYFLAAKAEIEAWTRTLAADREKLPSILSAFSVFMDQIEVPGGGQEPPVLVRLIGDELADRGSNDYLTLRLLGLLAEHGVSRHVTAPHSQPAAHRCRPPPVQSIPAARSNTSAVDRSQALSLR